MIKRIFFLLLLAMPLMAVAQQGKAKFGYVSYRQLYLVMPEYTVAQQNMDSLRVKFDAEIARSEKEFQEKFAEFLQGQKEFPANILLKRQKELQDLMEKGIAFRQEVQKLLAEAEAELLSEVSKQLQDALNAVGTEKNYMFILNTDDNAVPFINVAFGEDATEWVKQKLQVVDTEE